MTDLAAKPHSKPLIVLFHGLCSSPLEFNYLANYLKENGYRVESPTFAGYAFGGNATEWWNWVDEAATYVQGLQKFETIPVSVGGISLGSTLALAVASKLHNIHGVLALSTTLNYNGWAVPWYRGFIPFAMLLGLGDRYKYRERDPFGIKNQQIRAYIKKVLAIEEVSSVGGSYMTLRHMHEGNKLCTYVKQNLHKVTSSILTVHAIDDEIANTSNVDLVMNLSSSIHKRRIYLGNSYHMITVDNERETVSSEVLAFLDEIYLDHQTNRSGDKIISPELQRFLRAESRSERNAKKSDKNSSQDNLKLW